MPETKLDMTSGDEIMDAMSRALIETINASEFKVVSACYIDEHNYAVDDSMYRIVVRWVLRRRVWIYIKRDRIILEKQNSRDLPIEISIQDPNYNPEYVISLLTDMYAFERGLIKLDKNAYLL